MLRTNPLVIIDPQAKGWAEVCESYFTLKQQDIWLGQSLSPITSLSLSPSRTPSPGCFNWGKK